jgi:predicted ATPase
MQAKTKAFLVEDNWDDWFTFATMYWLLIFDAEGRRYPIGDVKIGQFAMSKDQRRPKIPDQFDRLDERFFSLGQEDSYYDNLNKIGPKTRDRVLGGLRDVARDPELFDLALQEKVTGVSLLRSVSRSAVTGQFHRMAHGGERLTDYKFTYVGRKPPRGITPLTLEFEVKPESYPPTNIHVLIGRNGVGKTTTLDSMARAIVDANAVAAKGGAFSPNVDGNASLFANLVSVTFSAFDPFEPLPNRRDKSTGVRYEYIGLKRLPDKEGRERPPKSPDDLAADFGTSVLICRQGARASRWQRALRTLEADPLFKDHDVADLASTDSSEDEIKADARKLFKELSSGHKIVLLIITRLIELVEEKTLVLLDEPEAHLHPPLLSALVRALSDLLINRNGVAIIATHSPVVLQEVPRSCVWKIRRSGESAVAERPEIETFGENVGILTREAFGLEVTQSGFHKMLREAVAANPDFDAVVERFGGELGDEARAIARGLLAAHDDVEEDDL